MNPQHDSAAGRLTYTVKLINGEASDGLKNWVGRIDKSLPNSFSHVTLFIDRGEGEDGGLPDPVITGPLFES